MSRSLCRSFHHLCRPYWYHWVSQQKSTVTAKPLVPSSLTYHQNLILEYVLSRYQDTNGSSTGSLGSFLSNHRSSGSTKWLLFTHPVPRVRYYRTNPLPYFPSYTTPHVNHEQTTVDYYIHGPPHHCKPRYFCPWWEIIVFVEWHVLIRLLLRVNMQVNMLPYIWTIMVT